MSWSSQQTKTKKTGSFAIIKGKAYPRVLAGNNPTRRVSTSMHDRDNFYHDPAIKLSESDLDAINRAEGAPLCYEHNRSDVVGQVHHSWLDDNEGKCLQIIGKIPTDTARGQKIVADIKCGKIKGLSVGYGASLAGGNMVASKTFHEISLVKEPFFDGCDLTVGVQASSEEKETGKFFGKHLEKIISLFLQKLTF